MAFWDPLGLLGPASGTGTAGGLIAAGPAGMIGGLIGDIAGGDDDTPSTPGGLLGGPASVAGQSAGATVVSGLTDMVSQLLPLALILVLVYFGFKFLRKKV